MFYYIVKKYILKLTEQIVYTVYFKINAKIWTKLVTFQFLKCLIKYC